MRSRMDSTAITKAQSVLRKRVESFKSEGYAVRFTYCTPTLFVASLVHHHNRNTIIVKGYPRDNVMRQYKNGEQVIQQPILASE